MGTALLIARLVLAAVFAVAGAAKLADSRGTRKSMQRFGTPRRLVAVGAVALPAIELAVAVALVLAATAWWAAAGALVLLGTFSTAVARLLARGEEADCNCFGSLSSTPADRRVLVRNGGLAALAAFVLIAGAGDAGATPGVTTGVVAFGLITLAAAGFAWMLVRQNGHLLLKVDAMESELRSGPDVIDIRAPDRLPSQGLPVGATLPEFAVHDLDGEPVSLADMLQPGLPLALVLADPDCPGCQRLLPHLGEAARERADRLTTIVVASGSVAGARAMASRYGLDRVLVVPDHGLNLKLRAYALPSAVLVGPDGRTAAELARGADAALEQIRDGAPEGSELRVVTVP